MEIKIEAKDKQPTAEQINQIVTTQNIESGSVQETSTQTFVLRMKPIDKDQHQKLSEVFGKDLGKVTEVRYETIGPTLGKELLQKTFVAALIAMGAILLYVAWAFKNIRFGVSAIIALIHDLLVVVGVFALLGHFKGVEVDSLFVTAVLTTMSFSVHDTIVVFDRIRESLKRGHAGSYEELIDRALTETIGRSLNNSLMLIFMLLALFLLGGETTKWFVLAMLVGTTSGAYSSPFIAAPILFSWNQLRDKHT